MHLGSANSWLTTHCQETRAHSAVRILTRLCCYYYQDLHWKPVHWTSRPSFCPASTPTYHTSSSRRWSIVSAADLSPVHFRGPQARQVSCYAFFEGWLLLSLPPCCLSSRTPFSLTLSPHLGALTIVWVNPLSVMRLTPHKPASPLLLRQHIRSSKRRWILSNPCLLIGALQRWLHPRRQDWDPLRWELAITELDRLLAPCPQSGD